MREIEHGSKVLARYINREELTDGLNFFSRDEEFIQVGAWKYASGKELDAHVHNKFERSASRTCEVFIAISGKLEVAIFTTDELYVDTVLMETGDVLILLECGHAVKILQDNTLVVEVKNGPFFGVDIDKKRFSYKWDE